MAREVNNSGDLRIDYGLLLLRFAGLFLFATAGWDKVHGLLAAIHAGQPLDTVGLAPLIKKMGLPLPVFCALYVVFNESLAAILITFGLFTRVAAACAAMSMAGAFYTAMRLGWEPFRAFIFLFMFAALAISGAGRFSLDTRYIKWQPGISSVDAGLFILRAGLLTFFILLFTLKKGNAAGSFARGPAAILLYVAAIMAVPAILGYFTQLGSLISCILWGWGAVSGLMAGVKWDIIPYRDAMLFLLFLVLALTGPGRYSLENLRQRR